MGPAFDPGSFRDPSGFIFRGEDGLLYRQVNRVYETAYRQLMESGLYEDLARDGLLVEHEEAPLSLAATADAVAVLRPRVVPFVSYPYEWCFSQLKEAALLTLQIQERAMRHGMSLKDCSAYNVLFEGAYPIFIDSLSFTRYEEGAPWAAYRQFCQHFLAPLALMAFRDARLNSLLRVHLDGVPLDLASRLLPWRTRARFGLLTHLHLHATVQEKDARRQKAGKPSPLASKGQRRVSRTGLRGLVDSLKTTVAALHCSGAKTEWSNYYANISYTDEAIQYKEQLVGRFVDQAAPRQVWDLGANTGRFSRVAVQHGAASVVAFDIAPQCVEDNFRTCKREGERRILPLCLDLTNPSPGLGWANEERLPLAGRGPADLVLALALVHHLAIGNNVPLPMIAEYFSELSEHLVIEFVPKDDPQTQRLLESRQDVFPHYTRNEFEQSFSSRFRILGSDVIPGTNRVVYLMQRAR